MATEKMTKREIFDELSEILTNQFGVPSKAIKDDSTFSSMNIDSDEMVNLYYYIEMRFGGLISDENREKITDMDSAVSYVNENQKDDIRARIADDGNRREVGHGYNYFEHEQELEELKVSFSHMSELLNNLPNQEKANLGPAFLELEKAKNDLLPKFKKLDWIFGHNVSIAHREQAIDSQNDNSR